MNKKQEEYKKLYALAQEGDELAYRDLLLKISNILRTYLSRHIILAELRELVLQEVITSIHNAFHTYNEKMDLSKWLFYIVKFQTILSLKSYQLTFERNFIYKEFEQIFNLDDECLEKQAEKDINLALLTKEEQRILRLFEKNELSISQTAKIMIIKEKELRKKINKIYVNFRDELNKQDTICVE